MWVRIQAGIRYYSLLRKSRLAVGPPSLLSIQSVTWFSTGINWPGREADYSRPYNTRVTLHLNSSRMPSWSEQGQLRDVHLTKRVFKLLTWGGVPQRPIRIILHLKDDGSMFCESLGAFHRTWRRYCDIMPQSRDLLTFMYCERSQGGTCQYPDRELNVINFMVRWTEQQDCCLLQETFSR